MVLGGCLALVAAVATSRQPHVVHPVTELVAAVTVGVAALRTRAPLAMALAASVFLCVYASLPGTGTPLWSFLGVLVIGFSVGAHAAGRRRWWALGALVVASYVVQLVTTARLPEGNVSWSDTYLTPVVIVGGPAFAGWLLQRSRGQTAELRRLALELDGERERHARDAALAERNRIARELHDVISHSVSVMVVQAGAAERLLADDAAARAQVRAVRETGKEALAELRRQLGVLRAGDPEVAAPLPGLGDLPSLVEGAGATLQVAGGDGAAVPAGLGLTVYRVVQESLTNVRRHAPGARATVRLRCDAGFLDVLVEDDGGSAAAGVEKDGNGLRGMRERVELYGGRLDAGPRPGRQGWRVRAVLPLTTEGPR